MIAPTRRRLLLAAAFVTALVSAALAPSEEAATPQKRAAKPPLPSSAAPQRVTAREIEVPPVSNYQRSIGEGVVVVDIFEPRPVPGAAPAAPAKPEPPKLPFTYIGRIEESGRIKVVLAQGEQMHVVAKGEQFGGSYRLEEVGLNELVVTYLPLEARQSLSLGDPK